MSRFLLLTCLSITLNRPMKLSYKSISKLTFAAVCAASLSVTFSSCNDDDEKFEEIVMPENPTRPSIEVGSNDVWIKVGESQTIAVTAGSGEYHAISLNPDRVKVEMNGDQIVATAVGIGDTEILVTDALSNVTNLKVVSYETKEIKFAEASFTADPLLGYSENFVTQVTEGNGGYQISSDNPRVEPRIDYETGAITFSATSMLNDYTATITVTDCVGVKGEFKVTVKASMDPLPASFISELEACTTNYINFDIAGITEHEPYWYGGYSDKPEFSTWYTNETGISRVNYESEGGQVYITPEEYVCGWWMSGGNEDFGGLFMSSDNQFSATPVKANILFKYSNNTWWPFRDRKDGEGKIIVDNAEKTIAAWWKVNEVDQHMDRAVWVHIK